MKSTSTVKPHGKKVRFPTWVAGHRPHRGYNRERGRVLLGESSAGGPPGDAGGRLPGLLGRPSKTPYEYRRVMGAKKCPKLEPDEFSAPVVRRIFELADKRDAGHRPHPQRRGHRQRPPESSGPRTVSTSSSGMRFTRVLSSGEPQPRTMSPRCAGRGRFPPSYQRHSSAG